GRAHAAAIHPALRGARQGSPRRGKDITRRAQQAVRAGRPAFLRHEQRLRENCPTVKNATNASAQNREREDEREETMNDARRAKSAWPDDKTRRELIGAAAPALALMPGAPRPQG